jgi:di/tricarboxylate transporter
LGGTITLIGTTTNILASALAAEEGFGAFTMFEFSKIGLLIFATGAMYIMFVGRKLLPERRIEPEIAEDYRMKQYLTEVIILEDSTLPGVEVVNSGLLENHDLDILEILRDGKKLTHPLAGKTFQVGDVLFVKTNTAQLLNINTIKGLAIVPEMWLAEKDLATDERGLLEVVIAPNSDLIGGTLESTNFRYHYNCTVVAIRKHGAVIRDQLSQVMLNFGDTLLLRGTTEMLEQIKREPGFIVTEELKQEAFRGEKIPVALAIISGVVILAALGQSILVTAIVGCVLMVLTGCLKVHELHEAIRWDVIFLLAGIIPLGLAIQRTGAAALLANLAIISAQFAPPLVVLAIFYLLTVTLAELISHSAAVVVMIPVGIAAATSLGLDPNAFILASMFAASMSFSTPVGYQTNAMVYGPGGYKFFDFTRIGAPFSLLMTITTPIYIYWIWGL